MRSIIVLGLVLLSTYVVGQDSYYGNPIDKKDIQSSNSIGKLLTENAAANVKLKGEILSTCAKKGCWMMVKLDNGKEIRVTFKDYEFFVPTSGVDGHPTIVDGEVRKEVTDVETLKHFAQDAGQSEEEISLITAPKEEYTFVASGVIIESKAK